ncbi:dihydrolipoyl dehydrogenase [Segatella baroniae F0067]|uniref:Dihydrolipoyl dehydrogenase n=1 Tax=Segatella baroniae F0067 TaxID=1115809 RepID=U2P5I6_9BACT|nr:dihydrolipoyl dehydrogenase [Segatella baroniae]ERK39416.1 dihydrolipoyl dehydrogenase [Segatella baroniae F0067]
MTTTDLIIIGGGPGGYEAAGHAAKHGLDVVIIERENVGGTCLNVGCIPTKTWCHEADVLRARLSADPQAAVDFQHVRQRQAEVVAQLRGGIETLLSAPGIRLVKGEARFVDGHTVTAGDETFTAPNIIIATGSEAKMPPIGRLDKERVMTSTELLAVDHVPESLVIVGAGVIGMEFAGIFQTFGSEVTVVEYLKECLPMLDSDIAKRLRKSMEKRGVTFHMQAGVTAITADGVTFERKGKSQTVNAEAILVATGRKPCLEQLCLEAAGVDFSAKGIVVDSQLRTSVEGVYAIGDVNGLTMLAHAASMQGIKVVNHILGLTDHIRLDIMPSAVFTYPEAASVGASEDFCKEHVQGYGSLKGYHRANGKAVSMDETEGMVKLLTDAEGRLIGCHAYGAHSADMIQEVSSLMCLGATVSQLRDMIHIHPTLGEILHAASMNY